MSTATVEPAAHELAEPSGQGEGQGPSVKGQGEEKSRENQEAGGTPALPVKTGEASPRPHQAEHWQPPAAGATQPNGSSAAATDLRALSEQEQDSDTEARFLLAEENQRLSAENRRLRGEQRRRETSLFLSELREGGRLTPAMELAGLEELLLTAGDQALEVSFPDGSAKPLAGVLRSVLSALPRSLSFSEAVPAPRHARPAELSADEQDIARALGLTAEEYAEIKSSS